jgi:hypothetical protein
MVAEATFRADFPEFSDTTKYTSSEFSLWNMVAESLLGPAALRWDVLFDRGCELVIAHHLAIAARNQQAAAAGGIPGEVVGPASAKSVDKVSVSRDVGAVTTEGGAFWNMTSYGVQFMTYVRLMGAGPIQL